MRSISILIPTYNYVCTSLVHDLWNQAEKLNIDYEILVADDGSAETCKTQMRAINALSHCTYIELKENIGRSRIRNYLAQCSHHEKLLFIDSDASVIRQNFLHRYAETDNVAVVYGGLQHSSSLPSPTVSLAWKYEKKAESRFTLEKRKKHPYEVFRTFNFMIDRQVFFNHPFDERIHTYGHEDTLFGKTLQENNIKIHHIDNPLMNCGLDNNNEVLIKTEQAFQTLYDFRQELSDAVPFLRYYKTIERIKLSNFFLFFYRLFHNVIRRNLLSHNPSLFLFAFYKLGYYCHVVALHSQEKNNGDKH